MGGAFACGSCLTRAPCSASSLVQVNMCGFGDACLDVYVYVLQEHIHTGTSNPQINRVNRIYIIHVYNTWKSYIKNHVYMYTCGCAWSLTMKHVNRMHSLLHLECHFFILKHRWSSSPGPVDHVPLKRDQGDWEWRLRFNDTPNAIGCISYIYISFMKIIHLNQTCKSYV